MGEARYPEFGAALKKLIVDAEVGLGQLETASRRPRRVPLKRSTLSSWQNGHTLPASWSALDALLVTVGELSKLPADRLRRPFWRSLYTTVGSPSEAASAAVGKGTTDSHLVRDADPVLLGVRQARSSAGRGPFPSYVERDTDEELDSALLAAARRGGLVLLKGDSTAGKTRTAFEAMTRVLPDLRILHPPRESLFASCVADARAEAERGGQCLIWLDELEYFLGPGRLDHESLKQLVDCRSILLATMRQSAYDGRTPQGRGQATAEVEDAYARGSVGNPVLKAAYTVSLPRVWSPAEVERAQASSDSRLAEAVRHHQRYGIAEYVSAGPLLWDRWVNSRYVGGNPRGHALVSCAVDLARAGLSSAIPSAVMASLHTRYLDGEADTLLSPEPFEEAMTWATENQVGVSRLLLRVGTEGWRPFDYLVDTLAQDSAAKPVPANVREAAVHLASSPEEQHTVGLACHRADRLDLAVMAFTRSAESGHVEAMLQLGWILVDQDKEGAAEKWWSQAARAGNARGMLNLGVRHSRKGRPRKAEKWWRRALDAGLPEAASKLASLVEARGENAEAERLWERALEARVADALFYFALKAANAGDSDEAVRLYQEAGRQGHRESVTNLAQLHLRQGQLDEAERLYMVAAEAGDFVAMRALGQLNEWRGRLHPADETSTDYGWRMASAMESLWTDAAAGTQWDAGAKAAKGWYQKASAHGDVLSLRLLGCLYQRRGKWAKAHKCFANAAELGDPASAAYFNRPSLAGAKPLPLLDEEQEETDDDRPWMPSPRTLQILHAALEIEADMAAEGLRELGSRPITADDWLLGAFGNLPAQAWEQGLDWRHRMVRAFDDLAHDIAQGRLPLPRCTGEEMALHIALEHAFALTVDSPDLVEDFAAGLPVQRDDFDWWTCKEALFEDHDVLMLYEPWMTDIENPHDHLAQQMGFVHLHPEDWFVPFREDGQRNPDRGFRRTPDPAEIPDEAP
ncbi:tetratricopeptide repeat protein [Streptomyces sp. NPDC059552]|uniref:tetratricopeptide repeat protein n=1 Tax=Streptomyces sp. NPDC059552 TaxID=3346862 RepID=UPI00367B6603